jgi:hypothetical protein
MQGDFNRTKTHCLRGHELSTDNVYVIPSTGGRQCRMCRDARKQEWQDRKLYGVIDRNAILVAQGGGCAICERTDCHWGKGFMNVWHIDHDPAQPGTYRGVLCGFCNTALGRLEGNIDKVLAYLEKHANFDS